MTVSARNAEEGKVVRAVALALIGSFWRDARLIVILVVLMGIIAACAAILAPVIFSSAIDLLANRRAGDVSLALMLLYAFIFGLSLALMQATRYLTFMCATRLDYIADCAFFERLLTKRPGFFLEHNQTEIGTARKEGQQALNIVLQFGAGAVLPGLVQIALSLALLGGVLSWDTAVIVPCYGMIVIGIDYFRTARVNVYLDAAIEKSQQNSRLIGNAVATIETLRHTRGEAWMAQRFAARASDSFANWRRYSLVSSLFSGISGLAVAAQLAITLIILVPRYDAGLITIGQLVLFNSLLLQLNEPFNLIGQAIRETADAVARFRPFAAMWNAAEFVEPQNAVAFSGAGTAIAFDNVSFHYENGRGVANLSFAVKRGSPVFITGETGAGKSTVLRLLLKDITPDSGRITIDGCDLDRISRDDWFARVGVVPQDMPLLNDSLAINIVLGRQYDRERLRRAAGRAAILSRIEAMPDGFDTVVGERGMKLSGGERQRIAIARALYGDPDILILDEASSALDADTEAEIMASLRELADSMTILSVTHRRSVIQPGDQEIRLAPPQTQQGPED